MTQEAPDSGAITVLLRRLSAGDENAERELFNRVYKALHAMAARKLRGERNDHTMQPTALIHEVYLTMCDANIKWADRRHFFMIAARTMRRILIDYARQRNASKRVGGQRVDLDKAQVFSLDNPEFLLSLDQCMDRLRQQSERACQVVELRAFAGLSMDSIASSLGVSTRTVKRDWQTARVWLYKELYGDTLGLKDAASG